MAADVAGLCHSMHGVCTNILGRSRVYPRVVEKPALVPNACKRGRGSPHAYLAVKLESRYTYVHTYIHSMHGQC